MVSLSLCYKTLKVRPKLAWLRSLRSALSSWRQPMDKVGREYWKRLRERKSEELFSLCYKTLAAITKSASLH